VNLGVSADELQNISKTHSEAIDNYDKIGIPVLKQTELGIPTAFAKKIPLDFTKKYQVSKKGDVTHQAPEDVSGTLFDLLKYSDRLQTAAGKKDPTLQKEVDQYIKDDLVPYVESIRYPFTGTSSIAPFKPRLLDDKDYTDASGRALSSNVLVAPGVPEGLEGLAPILSDLQDKLNHSVLT